ncbi:hypothetical protein [Rhodococcus sp. SGAir0479]|uniref:hypothetical protein n=1 Tax=Rhodococcus sp. SGAir0479 TaxID=2567884 RepID=UPI0010CCB213|nr:hypothetical protein [Rhodococcus sp. SGAir0479]QCQ94206.1 hypothetical protein E7742_22885 [Rhodococcus sp. SGAir0479]
MTNVVALRRTPKVEEPERISAIVVAGSGGAASTTTTYGLATALRLGSGADVAAIDGTSDGGNLLDRTAADPIDSARAIRQLGSRMAVSTAGVVVVGHGDTTDPALVDGLLSDRHLARFHDVGPALRSRRLGPLIEAGAGIVIVAPARSEPLSRMRDGLGWQMNTYGAEVLARTIVAISHQMPDTLLDLAPIRDALAPRTAGFVEVPFDAALTQPGRLDHRRLSPAALDAWTDALDALGQITTPHTDTDETAGELA